MIFTPYMDMTGRQRTIIGLSTGGAILASGAIGAGGSLLGGLFGGGGSAPQIIEDTAYNQMMQNGTGSTFNNLSNQNSTYLADMYSQLGTGNNPSYWQKYVNQAQPYALKNAARTFYGSPGNRDVDIYGNPTMSGQAQNYAAMYGLNPKAGIAQQGKVNQQWSNMEDQINQYFMGQGINLMNTTGQKLPEWSTSQQSQLADASKPVFSSGMPGVSSTNPMGGAMSALGGAFGQYAAGGYGNAGNTTNTTSPGVQNSGQIDAFANGLFK